MTDKHRDKIRRLRILQHLANVDPNPMGELALLNSLRADPQLDPDIEKVRRSLRYLSDHLLISLIEVDQVDWLAGQISPKGKQWLDYPGDVGLDIYSPGDLPEPPKKGRAGQVSSIDTLPPQIKAWLDQELVRLNFRNYSQLANALNGQGWEISRSAVGRYGKRFKEEQKQLKQSIEMAKAFAEVVGEDGAAMNQTLTALAQQELMAVVREARYDDEEIKLPALVQAIAQLNRSDINTRKFQIEQAARKKALSEAASQAEKSLTGQGMTRESIAAIKRDILGIE